MVVFVVVSAFLSAFLALVVCRQTKLAPRSLEAAGNASGLYHDAHLSMSARARLQIASTIETSRWPSCLSWLVTQQSASSLSSLAPLRAPTLSRCGVLRFEQTSKRASESERLRIHFGIVRLPEERLFFALLFEGLVGTPRPLVASASRAQQTRRLVRYDLKS